MHPVKSSLLYIKAGQTFVPNFQGHSSKQDMSQNNSVPEFVPFFILVILFRIIDVWTEGKFRLNVEEYFTKVLCYYNNFLLILH